MGTSNNDIAKLFREIAAAYTIKKTGNMFEIRAYENAADSIEHSTSEVKDLWEEGKLGEVPGFGKSIQGYLDELLRTGKVSHFEIVKKGIPKTVFELLDIPGVGPKTAQELVNLGIKSLDDLKKKIQSGDLIKKGFSGKIAQKILQGMEELGGMSGRMLLPYASFQADKILVYLKKSKEVIEAHPLGSLRRQVATVGDLDFSAASKHPQKVVDYFCKMPGVARIVEKGGTSATVMLQSGLHVDILVSRPESYGALLQHFTGSKSHNIHLRTIAEKKGLTFSEHTPAKTEEEFYKLLGMQSPPPEIREDTGEIEAALNKKLPDLVELKDIKGDLHTHSNFPFPNPSHGPGADSIEEMIKKAKELGYEFIGISDHPPGHGIVSKENMIKAIEKRTKFIQKLKKSIKNIRVLNGLEIDILLDGSLSVPDEALETLDYCIAGIHSGHRGSKDIITKRLMSALSSPLVDIISHPTNRLLNERDSSEADWEEIFKVCAASGKVLEINGYPNRLDLRDDLVRRALEYGVKFVINTDAHALEQMDNMKFGVSVARRGWVTVKDVVNTWYWKKFARWCNIKI
ncbi:MAG: DNA polymerase (family X) [Microgenomates group bacterium Gr01-1014_7]|nr:MAG: DNA polymerase (family X) [Microgenomates group bacterium Gr01-1014_7]